MRVAPNDGSDTATAGTAADPDAGSGHGRLVLAAMICAVAMTFIDQTIVAIAAPQLQNELSLSTEQVQWVINGYLLSLAALFAFGMRGRSRWRPVVTASIVAAAVVLFSALIAVALMPAGIAQRLGYAAWLGWLCVASRAGR